MVVGQRIKPQEDSAMCIFMVKKTTSNFWRPIEVYQYHLVFKMVKANKLKILKNPNLLDII